MRKARGRGCLAHKPHDCASCLQDAMFENADGQLRYAGANHGSLWPGACKPGLWHSALSRMGLLLRTAVAGPDGRPLVPLPPVFGNCTQVRLRYCVKRVGGEEAAVVGPRRMSVRGVEFSV